MSPTRRDVLKMAAGIPVAAATMTRVDAFEAFAQPDGLAPVPGDFHEEMDDTFAPHSPTAFAMATMGGEVTEQLCRANIHQAAKTMNEYKRFRLALVQAMPELEHAAADHPFVLMDEAVFGIVDEAWFEGIRAGAAFEHLRRELIGAHQSCLTCGGLGVVDGNGKRIGDYAAPPRTKRCPECDGAGTVPTAAVKGRAYR